MYPKTWVSYFQGHPVYYEYYSIHNTVVITVYWSAVTERSHAQYS